MDEVRLSTACDGTFRSFKSSTLGICIRKRKNKIVTFHYPHFTAQQGPGGQAGSRSGWHYLYCTGRR
ncbi:hypothetical protein, partial [Treponema sp. R6D11]